MSANEMTVEALLRAHAPHAPESLRERVFALEPKRQRRLSLPPRRLVLVALPAAVAIAVSVAVVHGIVGSGSPKPVAAQRTARAGRRIARGAGTSRVRPTLTTATRERRPALRTQPTAKSFAAPTRRRVRAPAAHRRVDPAQRRDRRRARAGDDARDAHRDRRSAATRSRSTTARREPSVIDLRIPTQNVKTALSRLAGLGTIVSQELSVTDLQQQFQTQSAQIAQLRRRIAALRAAIQDPALADAQKVLLRIQLAESQRALSQRLHARKGTVAAGTTSTVSLVIGTKKAIATVPHQRGRLGRMVHSAVGFLALEAIIALYALIVISPFAILAALAWFWRRRSVDRLLAA